MAHDFRPQMSDSDTVSIHVICMFQIEKLRFEDMPCPPIERMKKIEIRPLTWLRHIGNLTLKLLIRAKKHHTQLTIWTQKS